MLLPGPEAQQLATYIGWLMHRHARRHRRRRAVRAAVALHPHRPVVAVHGLRHVPAVAGVLYGIKPAVVAIVLAAAWRIGSRALQAPPRCGRSAPLLSSRSPARCAFPAASCSAPAVIGALGGAPRAAGLRDARPRRRRQALRRGPDRRPDADPGACALPASALLAYLAVGLALWAAAMGVLLRSPGRQASSRASAGSSPRPRCSPSAAPTRCCRTSTRRRWSTTSGSRGRR